MEDVGHRRIIQDEGFVELPAESTQIFNVTTVMENTGLTEKSRSENSTLIQ